MSTMDSNQAGKPSAHLPIFENSTDDTTAPTSRFGDGEDSRFSDVNLEVSSEEMLGRMGQAFVNARKLTQDEVGQIVQLQRRSRIRFGEAAIKLGLLSEQDVHEVLSQQFNYQTVSKHAAGSRKRISTRLLIAHSPYSTEAEAIRRFRSEVLLRVDDSQCVVVALVSPNSKEGKSHLCASLAIAFAQLNMRTLLIDGNLRKPTLHQFFDLPNKTGLSTMLVGRTLATLDLAHLITSNLHVITSGPKPPNPNEILSAPNLIELLDRFKQEVQVIIIDTPPSRVGSDAQVIAQQAGTAVMVCRKDFTKISDLKDAQHDMKTASVNLLGSFYNSVPVGADQAPGILKRFLAKFSFHRSIKK